MSKAVLYHQPCPDQNDCRSSDAYTVYDDGHGHCYSCGKTFNAEGLMAENVVIEKTVMGLRGISKKTMTFYGIQIKLLNGQPDEVLFPYGEDAAKTRRIERVNGKIKAECLGEFKDSGLFGQNLFAPGSKESITIVEGEFDAPSAFEMLRERSACVSLKSGAQSALTDCRKHYEYINSFDKIYLCFDNDGPGQDAIRSLQGLFDFRKVYIVKLGRFKDANEYLQNRAADEFESTWRGAKRYVPDNIISSFVDVEKALDESSEDQLATYPFSQLNEMTYGIFAGEVVVVKAPEGVGKTEFFRALEHHILKETDHPIGVIHLEEDNATTIKALAGYALEVPATLPDCGLSKADILRGYKRAVRDDEGRVHIHASFDVENEEAFLGNIRFLVSAAGCRIVFFDHITWLATGGDDEDERKKLDRISQKLKLLAKELRCAVIEISHVNDDGKTRGSRNITKVANTVISLERDLDAGDTRLYFVLNKVRLGGRTGPAGFSVFDRATGMLKDHVVMMENSEDIKGE